MSVIAAIHGKKGTVTKVDKNTVYEIDGQSAYDFYRHYLGDLLVDLDIGLAVFEPNQQHFSLRLPSNQSDLAFDIHEGIDSTILILKHRLKGGDDRPAVEIVKDYGDLPQIECFPGQLNQVFMNILANAIDALEESDQKRSCKEIAACPDCITIKTEMQDQQTVTIRISDNDVGMTEAVKARIFDHLFTTKAVGKGTGLGLAIAHQIVEEVHSGKLYCASTLGQGTEFAIMLPVTTSPVPSIAESKP